MERNGETVFLLRTERNGTEWNVMERYKKRERERNDLAEGPRSRTERNDFKKSERAQPYVSLFVSCRFYTALILSTIVASHELKSFRMVDVKINA